MSSEEYRKNIPKLYLFGFSYFFLVAIPVLVPFWQTKGLSLHEIFLLQAVFGATLILIDIPAGYAADLFGRKNAMIIGSLVHASSYAFLALGNSFWDFVAFEVVCGIGTALIAGCDIALLYNSLEKIPDAPNRTRTVGLRMTAMTAGEGCAALLASALASISLALPIYVSAFTSWIPFFVALTIREPEGQKLSRVSHKDNVKSIVFAVFRHSRLLTLALVSFVFYGFATYCAVWALQPFWKSRGVPFEYFGYLWAINCFTAAIVSRFAHAIEVRIGSTLSIIVIALLPIIGYFGMGAVPGLLGIVFGLAFPLCRGLNQVLFTDAINSRVPAEMRSTVNSIGSLGMRAVFIIFGPLIGSVLDSKGPDQAFITLGLIFAVGFFTFALPLLGQRQHFRVRQ